MRFKISVNAATVTKSGNELRVLDKVRAKVGKTRTVNEKQIASKKEIKGENDLII